MRQVLGPGTLGRPRGIGWRGRWEGGSGWGTYVNPWLIHVNVWPNPLQCCEVISLQLIKINEKKKKIKEDLGTSFFLFLCLCLPPSLSLLSFHCTLFRILVTRPQIESGPSAVKARSPNRWTTREFPTSFLIAASLKSLLISTFIIPSYESFIRIILSPTLPQPLISEKY